MSDYQPTPPAPAPYSPPPSAAAPTAVLSILSLIFGILGAISGFLLFGGLPAIAGVVLGFIARKKEPAARGMWLTGIITGFVGIAGLLAIIAFYAVIIGIAVSQGTSAGFR